MQNTIFTKIGGIIIISSLLFLPLIKIFGSPVTGLNLLQSSQGEITYKLFILIPMVCAFMVLFSTSKTANTSLIVSLIGFMPLVYFLVRIIGKNGIEILSKFELGFYASYVGFFFVFFEGIKNREKGASMAEKSNLVD